MIKNYFMVLIALLAFSLNANAQENDNWETVNAPEDTEVGTEGYNMIITLPDGTNITINTKDVDEIKFSNGQVSVSGTNIMDLLMLHYELSKTYTNEQIAKLELALKQYISNLVADYLVNTPDIDLSNYVIQGELQAALQNYATTGQLNTLYTDLNNKINGLNTDLNNKVNVLDTDLSNKINTLGNDLVNIEAAFRVALSNLTQDVVLKGLTIDENATKVNDLYGKYDSVLNKYGELSGQVGQNKSDIEWLKYFWSQFSGRLDALEAEIKSMKEQ